MQCPTRAAGGRFITLQRAAREDEARRTIGKPDAVFGFDRRIRYAAPARALGQ